MMISVMIVRVWLTNTFRHTFGGLKRGKIFFIDITGNGYSAFYTTKRRLYLFSIYLYARKPKLDGGYCGTPEGTFG